MVLFLSGIFALAGISLRELNIFALGHYRILGVNAAVAVDVGQAVLNNNGLTNVVAGEQNNVVGIHAAAGVNVAKLQ